MSIVNNISKWMFPCESRIEDIIEKHDKNLNETLNVIRSEFKENITYKVKKKNGHDTVKRGIGA